LLGLAFNPDFVTTGGISLRVPEGHPENSPAFQRREGRAEVPSPEGTADLTGGRGENGGGIISPQIQRRPQMGEPEGWPHEGAKKRELKKSIQDLWGQAVPTPIGAGTACPRTTRRNLLHTSQFLRCCDWPRRHSRAPATIDSGSSASLFQPFPRDGTYGQELGLLRVLRSRFRVGGSVRRGRRTLHARARVLPISGWNFSRPFGTRNLPFPFPALKRRAIVVMSLRDNVSFPWFEEVSRLHFVSARQVRARNVSRLCVNNSARRGDSCRFS